jgi:inorganic pyrophosphatase
VNNIDDLRPILREKIEHFFAHYKDLEKNKWSKILGWGDKEKAKALILEGIERAKAEKAA